MPMVRVTRAFMLGGEVQSVGDIVDVPAADLRWLIAVGKAEAIDAQAERAGPMTTDTAAAIVPGRRRKTRQ